MSDINQREHDSLIAEYEAEVKQLKGELALALAHDTQPYPTAEAYEKVCAALNALRAEREWISVKDRLPEDKSDVIAFYGEGAIETAAYYADEGFCDYDGAGLVSVTHWMPLPEKPIIPQTSP